MYDGGLLVCGMYPTSFFPSNTLKINRFATNKRTHKPVVLYYKGKCKLIEKGSLLFSKQHLVGIRGSNIIFHCTEHAQVPKYIL